VTLPVNIFLVTCFVLCTSFLSQCYKLIPNAAGS